MYSIDINIVTTISFCKVLQLAACVKSPDAEVYENINQSCPRKDW